MYDGRHYMVTAFGDVAARDGYGFALVERFVREARLEVPPLTLDHEEAP